MKLVALIVASVAALAPLQAYSPAQVQKAQPQLAWGSSETCSNDGSGVVNVNIQACDVDIL